MSKRSNGEGTISKRSSDGRWIGQITLGYDEFGKVEKNLPNSKKFFLPSKLNLCQSLKNLMWIICSPIGLTKKNLSNSLKNLPFKLTSAELTVTSKIFFKISSYRKLIQK